MAASESIAGTALSASLAQIKLLLSSPQDDTVCHEFMDQFRSVIGSCQKLTSSPNALLPPCMGELADILLTVISSSVVLSLEARSLCGVAFALVVCSISEPNSVGLMYSKNFLTKSSQDDGEVRLRLYKGGPEVRVNVKRDHVKLCLAYGLLQAQQPFWVPAQIGLLTDKIFPLLETEAFSHSRQTLIAFKALVLWAKRFSSITCINFRLAVRVFNIVSSNWESPFNGVREQNSFLLEELLSMTAVMQNEDAPSLRPVGLLDLVLDETSWMVKSKFYLLSPIIKRASPLHDERKMNDIVAGLISSLRYSHLVSAGTELYCTLLDRLSFDHWQVLFLEPILKVLVSSADNSTTSKVNVFNYWICPTMKKYRNCLEVIHSNLVDQEHSMDESLLLSIILCTKTARKEGHETISWKSPYLRAALIHRNYLIRMNAFAVVCVSCKTSLAPSDEEFSLVETYLEENINCDSTPLRQSLFSSFTSFIVRMRDSCLLILRGGTKESTLGDREKNINRIMLFLENLYVLLTNSLEIGSNYQRRIAALELYKIVLFQLMSDSTNRKFAASDAQRVMKYAIVVGKWGFTSEPGRECLLYCLSDPADDVREAASSLLTNYFKISDNEVNRFSLLYHKGIGLCCDSMFYNADAGAILIYTVVSLAYKNSIPPSKLLDLKTERATQSILSLAESQATALKSDLLYAAKHGSPLYGCLEILGRLICDKNSPEYGQTTQHEFGRLMDLIELVVAHLLTVLASKSSSISDYAPSFLEMGEAIKTVVEDGEANVDESDKLHLSPMYQLLLSTIWLNLKSCCWIASRLYELGAPICTAQRCLGVILSVLRQTRHKGALESAGNALSFLVSVMSSSSVDSHLLDEALQHSLDRLETTGGDTATMRGAGAVVLIHRLVAGESRSPKSLICRCLRRLVHLVENQGHAQALHLLAILVKDKSLAQDTAAFIHRLAAASFRSLAHSSWAVRNTGLQLFGAIVPRLIGQRKTNENDTSCSCYHLPYEELYYHASPLVTCILDELKSSSTSHSTLVPLLTLMSSLSVGISTIIDTRLGEIFKGFVDNFQSLISSPVSKVRQLAAEAIAWFCSLSQIPYMINLRVTKIVAYVNNRTNDNEIKSENSLHGFLLNTKYLLARYEAERIGVGTLREAKSCVDESLKQLQSIAWSSNLSYVCRAVVAQIVGFDDTISPVVQVKDLSLVPVKPYKALGLPVWQEAVGREIGEKCSPSELSLCLISSLESGQPDLIRALLVGLASRSGSSDLTPYVSSILDVLLRVKNKNEELLKVALDLMLRYEIRWELIGGSALAASKLFPTDGFSFRKSILSLRTAVACGLVASDLNNVDLVLLRDLLDRLRTMAQPSQDESIRLLASFSLTLIAPIMLADVPAISSTVYSFRCSLWEIAVNLLEDESDQVRDEATKFAGFVLNGTQLPREGTIHSHLNPYLCIKLLHLGKTLVSLFSFREAVHCLWTRLRCSKSELSSLLNPPTLNPFDDPKENIYSEPVKIIALAYSSLLDIVISNPVARSILITEEVLMQLEELKDYGLSLRQFSEEAIGEGSTLIDANWYVVARRLSLQFQLIKTTTDLDPELLALVHSQYSV